MHLPLMVVEYSKVVRLQKQSAFINNQYIFMEEIEKKEEVIVEPTVEISEEEVVVNEEVAE